MQVALPIVMMVVLVTTIAGVSDRFGISAPLLLVVVGVGVSFLPGVPRVDLNADVVLFGFLPPLLYSAAIRTSLIDFRANRQAIATLSVGLVAFTTVVVGLVAWWVIPSMSLAAGFAIGAVVAPPDAVAATAVGRRVGMPRRIVTILEGESLVNDAAALVALNAAIAALKPGSHLSVVGVGWDFVVAAGGGVLVGLGVAFVLALVRKQIDNSVLDTTLSFVAPFAAFLPAEGIHASGVLAVVVTGLVLGHKSPVLQSASSRIAENTNWRTVAFLLENLVFFLIGLQLRRILSAVSHLPVSVLGTATSCVVILLTVVLARVVWVLTTAALYHFGTRRMRERAWSWGAAIVVSWAGMRGVVTLAAVFLLPSDTPRLAVLQLVAFVVVAGTLIGQGLTLPPLVRRLNLPRPDVAEDALQTAALVTVASRAGNERLDELIDDDTPEEVIDQLRQRSTRRSNNAWERLGRAQTELEPPSVIYRRLRIEMLEAERNTILAARDSGTLDDEVLRTALAAVDVEESLLDRIDDAESRLDNELEAPPTLTGGCEHLRAAPRVAHARTPGACEECLRDGTRWVHLRMCLTCGHVGCCDSSVGHHADGHFRETEHPVMRSMEPGEAWRWCYVDEQLG
ncbi:MAG: Na+/H+ antiporter [Actinomycetota bacterium]|nr:Na+/H+ antiporter [Actinomycetota bacterium]